MLPFVRSRPISIYTVNWKRRSMLGPGDRPRRTQKEEKPGSGTAHALHLKPSSMRQRGSQGDGIGKPLRCRRNDLSLQHQAAFQSPAARHRLQSLTLSIHQFDTHCCSHLSALSIKCEHRNMDPSISRTLH